MKSLEHGYAQVAYERISQLAAKPDGNAKAKVYGSLCHAFPSMVLLNGLRLTAAFFRSKSGGNESERSANAKAYKQYLDDMGQAIGIQNWDTDIPRDGIEYRQLTRQALRAAVWFKRYAEAVLNAQQGEHIPEPEQETGGETGQ